MSASAVAAPSARPHFDSAPTSAAQASGEAPQLRIYGGLCPPGTADALTVLFASLQRLSEMRSRVGSTHVEAARADREIAEGQAREASQRAQAAASKGGLFDALARDLGALGLGGLCTFRYDLVAADAVVHEFGDVGNASFDALDAAAATAGSPTLLAIDLVARKTNVSSLSALQRPLQTSVGPDVKDSDVAPYTKEALTLNTMVAAATTSVLTAGSTTALWIAAAGVALGTSGYAIQRTRALDGVVGEGGSQWVGLGMQVGGSLVSGGANVLADSTAVAGAAQASARVVQGGTTTLRGADRAVAAVHSHDSAEARLDERRATFHTEWALAFADHTVTALKEAARSAERTMSLLAEAIHSANDTPVSLSTLAQKG